MPQAWHHRTRRRDNTPDWDDDGVSSAEVALFPLNPIAAFAASQWDGWQRCDGIQAADRRPTLLRPCHRAATTDRRPTLIRPCHRAATTYTRRRYAVRIHDICCKYWMVFLRLTLRETVLYIYIYTKTKFRGDAKENKPSNQFMIGPTNL